MEQGERGAASHSEPTSKYISILRCEYLKLRTERSYWEAQFKGSIERIDKYKAEIEELKAQVQKLNSRIFSQSKTEASRPHETGGSKAKRGKRPGSKGFGRRTEGALETREEDRDLPPDECYCPKCGREFSPLDETADSELIEFDVRAHRRIIKRKRYRKSCHCSGVPGVLAASPEPKVIPKGKFGVSFLVHVLLYKFYFHMPLNRIVQRFGLLGLKISAGTISGNFVYLSKLMLPIYKAIAAHNKSEHHWHADETRWMVFVKIEGKTSHRWYLWVFQSETSVFFKIVPTRGASVIKEHFSDSYGILSVDRYVSYKTLLMSGNFLLAYCWAHVRRDFLEIETGHKNFAEWSQKWLKLIGELYHTNNVRVQFVEGSTEFGSLHRQLEEQVLSLREKLESEFVALKNEPTKARRTVIESMLNHWQGLILFVRYPWVPMDNNPAERAVRGPVVARKGYYGSGSEESALCAAEMFSIFATLDLWRLNPTLWLTSYLEACAHNGSDPPSHLNEFLPWKMSLKRLQELGGKEQLKPYSSITREEIQCATVDEVFLKKKSKSFDKLSLKRRRQNTEGRSPGKSAKGSTGPGPPEA
jgi:transposase